MTVPGSLGYDLEDDGTWFDPVTGKHHRAQELIPTDWPLHFHLTFWMAVAEDPTMDCIGIYTNGWEL